MHLKPAEDVSVPSPAPAFPQQMATPHGYYTFVPYAAASGSGNDAAAPANASPSGNADLDPAAAAAVAAANAALAAISPRPPGYIHVVVGIPPRIGRPAALHGSLDCQCPIQRPSWAAVARPRDYSCAGVILCDTRPIRRAQAHWAIRGVSNAVHKSYSSQAFALDAFNKVVHWGGIEVA